MQRMATSVQDVRRIEIGPLEPTGKRLVDWSVWLKGFELQWQEEQTLDANNMRIEFRQTHGLFALYKGVWQVTEVSAGTQLDIEVDIDSGLPHLSRFVNPILVCAFEAFARNLGSACTKMCVTK